MALNVIMGGDPPMKLTLVDFTGVMKSFARPTASDSHFDGTWLEFAQGARGGGSPLAEAGEVWGRHSPPPAFSAQLPFLVFLL